MWVQSIETAELLGVNVNTVRTRIRRGLLQLKLRFEQEYGDDENEASGR